MQKKQLFFILKFSALFISINWFLGLINNLFIILLMQIIKGILSFIGGSSEIIGNQIIINGNPLVLIKECTGTPMYALFAAFALAYQCKNSKLKGIIYGLLMLFSLNVLRIFTLILAASYKYSILAFLHDFLWPSSFFIFTLLAAWHYIKGCSK
jgi:exosortase/archaeosortase family protein